MLYCSTRGRSAVVDSAQAVLNGLAEDGGLYMPEAIPAFDVEGCLADTTMGMANRILSALLPDIPDMEALVRRAYTGKFETDELTPTVKVGDFTVLELFRGPTSAFKDVALCMLPQLLTAARDSKGMDEEIRILTATSGDTGKAALAGFADVPGVSICVFYPNGGVSAVQRAQMVTQKGRNVHVCAVEGNFDDAQTGVKQIFAACASGELLKDRPFRLSSANSINIGRLAPQVTYYFKAYRDLLDRGEIRMGEKVNFCVPTGNFGDILAGYLAKLLGLPVGRLICASNSNNVLTDFIRTGTYDRRRAFYKTDSPSMDILVSSNLERLLYLLSGDCKLVSALMHRLNTIGVYTVPAELKEKVRTQFWADYANDAATADAIRSVWEQHHYLCDPHTAVGWKVAENYVRETGDQTPMVVLSTASAYKFPAAVLSAIDGELTGDEFGQMERLSSLTGVPIPANLSGLRSLKERHTGVIPKDEMQNFVFSARNREEVTEVTVRVPATTANLGPGFDAFGCALGLYTDVSFEKTDAGLEITGCDEAYAGPDNLAYTSYCAVMASMNQPVEGVKIHIQSNIPICRGLGSSAALLVAGALGANALGGNKLSLQGLMNITNAMEGHPDNLAPAFCGGLTASMVDNGLPVCVSFPLHPDWEFLALVPDYDLPTAKARAILPEQVSRADAVYNVAHGALVLKALELGDEKLLRNAMQDKLHQNYRKHMIRDYEKIEALVRTTGAAFCLSGAGPTLLCITRNPGLKEKLEAKLASVTEDNWQILPLHVQFEGAKIIDCQ